MSEDNTPPPPSTPKTSAVPLKKETVRITLRPREESSPVAVSSPADAPRRTTAPVQLPSAPLPPPAPKIASSPVKLPPAAPPAASPPPAAFPTPVASAPPPAATVPLTAAAPAAPRPPTAPPAAPMAPRPPVVPGAAPRVETGATTAPLTKPAAAAPKPPGTVGTAPLAGAPAAGLPKATVKLQQTQPMARPSVSAPPSAPVKRAAAADSQQFYDDDKDPEAGLMPLSAICFVLSAALLVLQMFGGDKISAQDGSALMVPHSMPAKWETYNKDDGTWMNRFANQLPAIPQ